jgi:protein-S-isoprenylcysteine O-methyltransferase Ste14
LRHKKGGNNDLKKLCNGAKRNEAILTYLILNQSFDIMTDMMLFQIIAIFLLAAFYIIYITKMLMLKKQNIQGSILGKGQKPKEKAIFEIILKIFTFLIVPVQFGSVILSKYLYVSPFHSALHIIGLILLFIGVLLFLIAIITMRNNWRAGYNYEQDTQLVTNGIYRISRNPAFVGFDLLYIGGSLAFPNIINIVFSIFVIIIFHIQILGEEKFLADKFGDTYIKYKNKVRRYL